MQASSSIRREIDFVASCVRTFLSTSELSGLSSLDWPAIEGAADRHSVTPLVAHVLKQHDDDLFPLEVRERLDQRLRAAARRNLIWLTEWQRSLNAFESAGVHAISLKGPAFALRVYGNIALRESTDLDFLVMPQDVPRARDALVREGYRVRFPAAADLRSGNCQLDLAHPDRGTLIDLHWGALHAMFPFQLSVESLFASVRIEQVEDISYLSLSPEHLLLYLCAHGTKHCWAQMRWLCDVACHLRATPNLDWDFCIGEARKTNCDLVLTHSLQLVGRLLGLDLPQTVKHYCEGADGKALADTASAFLFDENGRSHGKALRYHLAFAKDWQSRTRLLVTRLFVPEEQDWQTVRLPRSLRCGYYAVRPLRFTWERLVAKQ